MGDNRIMRGGGAPQLGIALVLLALLGLGLAACGGGETTVTVTSEESAAHEVDQEADAEVLDEVISRQLGAVAAYQRTLPFLRGARLQAARLFRAQEQEHVDGLLEAYRALGESAGGEPETITANGLKTEADHVLFLYELENATIELEYSALSKLTAPTAKATLESTIANQAQHLVVLRKFLGADLAESIPFAFETGAAPAP